MNVFAKTLVLVAALALPAAGICADSAPKSATPSADKVYKVSELFKDKTALDKKQVTVKGKVVKVSSGIMNRNWIHLQDGSGSRKKGTHNLVITSQELPAVGDVVTMQGTLYKDKDFGSGYKYDVIMEEATIQK